MRKKILSITLALCMIICMMPSVAMAAETSVAIDETNFPDENFRNIIAGKDYDTNLDGYLSEDEIDEISKLDCSGKEIKNLKGIELLENLITLTCSSNQLTSLDISKNLNLRGLFCSRNQLTNLDASKNTALTHLSCASNQLTSLDVSKNVALVSLECSSNQLTDLDVSTNTALTTLQCGSNQLQSLMLKENVNLHILSCESNQLSSLDVSNNTALTSLTCNSNQLGNLDVSKNTALTTLSCKSNQLSALDISENTALKYLYCSSNQLTSLDLSKNTALTYLDCSENRKILESNNTNAYDLSELLEGFDASKMSEWSGGTVDGNILSFNDGSNTVTYKDGPYLVGTTNSKKSTYITFTLHKHDFGEYQSNGDGTHTVVCQSEDCGDTITEKCSGGEATLTEKAVCSVCKSAYGSYLPGSIEISGTTASAKRGKEVTINVNLDKNTGLAALRIKLEYDKEALELKNVTNGEIFGDEYFFGLDENFASDTDEAILMWNAAKTDETATETGMVTPVDGNTTKTGTLATLTFTIKDEAAIGDTPVKFTCISSDYDAIDAKTDALTVTTNDAKVTVVSFIYGDINDDDSIDLNDIIQLRRYLARWKSYTVNMDSADVDMDGKVTLRDVTILEYHVAGWEKYSTLPVTA